MGCFLGCFGFSSKRKRRKPANKILPGDPRHGSYEPLDSSVSGNYDVTDNPISSDSQLSNKIKEKSSIKIGKKVSFNLNVQTYEPLSKDEAIYDLSESEGEDESEKNDAQTSKEGLFTVSEGNSSASKLGSLPPNFRYQNLADSYGDEDDMACMESDLDDDDEDEVEDEYEYEYGEDECEDKAHGGIAIDIDDKKVTKSEFLKQLNSQSLELSQGASWIHLAEEKISNHKQLPGSVDVEFKSTDSKRNTRDRGQFVNSVLNPVENITQWKAVKAKASPTKHQRKENIALEQETPAPFGLKAGPHLHSLSLAPNYSQSEPLLQEVAVDASLSNWLASRSRKESKATSVTNNGSISVKNIPSKGSIFERSCLQQSREDTPILDIPNLKA